MEANWSDPEYVRGRARRKTIWIVGFVLHVGLFALLVGWPYIRAEMRGRDSRRAFGVFAACFYGGEVTGEAGLSLPAGDRLAYASLYLSGDAGWPGRCRPLLSRLIDGEPLLLYPGVKLAEERVRQSARLADAELAELADARSDTTGPIPTDALAAVGRVAGTLSDLAREIDPLTPIEDEVITLDDVALPDPARVPLTTASDAVIHLDARADGIRVHAVDARGLSRTRSLGGRSRAGRIHRPSTAIAMIDGGREDPVVVHATSPARCREDPSGCSRRSTGLATWIFGEGLTEPVWLSGHPRGRIDRVLAQEGRTTWMVAVTADGLGGELRRFSFPVPREGNPSSPSDTPTMLSPDLRVPLDLGASDDVLIAGARLAYSRVDTEQGQTHFFARVGDGVERLLGTLSGRAPFVLACAPEPFFALGTDAAVGIVEARQDGAVMVSHRETGLGSVFDPRRPSRDRARLVCDSTGASLVLHHDDGRLALVTCRNGAPCDSPRELSTEVGGFAAVRSEGATLVAWTGTEGDGAVRAATYGDTEVAARVIAACFADAEGFCGVPRIAERNRRILIATQEGGDLRVLETTDGGRTFAPMTGVR